MTEPVRRSRRGGPREVTISYGVPVAEASKDTAPGGDGIYSSFDRFLKQAIREYYDRGWTTQRATSTPS